MDKIIVVVKERWVLIGEKVAGNDTGVELTNASAIRRWGTERGLGQIAVAGVTPETVLDFCGDVTVPQTAILYTIRCLK